MIEMDREKWASMSDVVLGRTPSDSEPADEPGNDVPCNRCGECCVKNTITDLVTPPEFAALFLGKGKVEIKCFARGHYIARPFKPSADVTSSFYYTVDDEDNLCPFLDFDIAEAAYACTIQGKKPEKCAAYHCKDGKECVYGKARDAFGTSMEPPGCNPCEMKESLDEIRASDIEENGTSGIPENVPARPCEEGFISHEMDEFACKNVERRVHYFLAYTKQHPMDDTIMDQGKRLRDMLYVMDDELQHGVLPGEKTSVAMKNKDNYRRYIRAIEKSFLEYNLFLKHHAGKPG